MGILYLGELLTPTKKVRPIVELNQRKKNKFPGRLWQCLFFKNKRILCDIGIICITITTDNVDVPILPWTSNQCKLYVIKFCEMFYFPNIHSRANNESCGTITSMTAKKLRYQMRFSHCKNSTELSCDTGRKQWFEQKATRHVRAWEMTITIIIS